MLSQPIFLDLATETGRRFGVLPPDFAPKMVRRLRRKFKVKVSVEEITMLADGYVAIYRFAASVLHECLLPNNDEYASLSHVDGPKFMGKIAAQFPAEDASILNEIAHWVIQYEYLR